MFKSFHPKLTPEPLKPCSAKAAFLLLLMSIILGWPSGSGLAADEGYQIVSLGGEITVSTNESNISMGVDYGLKAPDGTVFFLASMKGEKAPPRFSRILGQIDEHSREQVLKKVFPSPALDPGLIRSLDCTKLIAAGFTIEGIDVSVEGAKLYLMHFNQEWNGDEPDKAAIILDKAGLVTSVNLPGNPDYSFYAKERAFLSDYFQERAVAGKKMGKYLGKWAAEQGPASNQRPEFTVYPGIADIKPGQSLTLTFRVPESFELLSIAADPALGLSFGSFIRSSGNPLEATTYNLINHHQQFWTVEMTAAREAKPGPTARDNVALAIATNQGTIIKKITLSVRDHQPEISDIRIEPKGREIELSFTAFDEKGDLLNVSKSVIAGYSFRGGMGGRTGGGIVEKIEAIGANRFRISMKMESEEWTIGRCEYHISVSDSQGIDSTGGDGIFVFPLKDEK